MCNLAASNSVHIQITNKHWTDFFPIWESKDNGERTPAEKRLPFDFIYRLCNYIRKNDKPQFEYIIYIVNGIRGMFELHDRLIPRLLLVGCLHRLSWNSVGLYHVNWTWNHYVHVRTHGVVLFQIICMRNSHNVQRQRLLHTRKDGIESCERTLGTWS